MNWDNIRKNIVDQTRLRAFGKDISGRQFLADDDIGYSIKALREAFAKKIINPNMSVKKIERIMEENNLAPYGFKLDQSIINQAYNPFLKDLPYGDTIRKGDFE